MNNCCDCKSTINLYLVYPNSILGLCKECFIKRISTFKSYFSTTWNFNPVVVPAQYIDIPQKKCWFPQIIIRFGKVDTLYGMSVENYIEFQNQAYEKMEMNIP